VKKLKFLLFLPYIIIQLTWGIIQNLAGAAIFVFLLIRHPGTRPYRYRFSVVTPWKTGPSLGLGIFIFSGPSVIRHTDPILVHEYGHNVQSLILGPLFLPVVGFPSMFWAGLPRFEKKRSEQHINYYSFYPERWANRIGYKITGQLPPGFKAPCQAPAKKPASKKE